MNFIESEILKGKYFPNNSRKRLRAMMVNLFIIFGVFTMLLYAYENMLQGYYLMVAVELVMIVTLTVAYLLFPHYTSINTTAYMILGALTFLLSLSLVVEDKDPELSLFWLASLPIFVFFFLGEEKGIRWSINMFLVLLFIPLISFVTDIEFVYSWELLSQILFGYLVVSYMLYIIEKERNTYEEKLTIALKDNQTLFKEVHHRTKNNMQIIMGLLQTQAFTIKEPKYKKMFEAHVDRLKAMSMMHKNLYTNHSYEEVNIKVYLEEIAKSLQTYSEHKILMDIESLWIDMKTAMNIGLIFNEAVTNAIEHAYTDGEGIINIELTTILDDCCLIIEDKGKGFDSTQEFLDSLGMILIEDLSRSLPDGEINITSDKGTKIEIKFKIKEDI